MRKEALIMKKLAVLILVLALCVGMVCPVSAAGNYSSVYDIPDEEYLREDFHSVNDYGALLGYTGKHYSQQSATFPDDLVAVLPESSYVPYKYPSKSITRLELPTSLVILDGSFETYTTGGYSNLHEVNFEELTNLKYIGGWFQSTPLYSIDLRNTQVVRIANEGTFSNNRSLQAFYASKTLRRIDYGVFHDCPNLSYIELNEGLEYIGGHNFGSNTFVTALDVDDSIKRYITIPSTVTYIGEGGLPTYYKVWADNAATTMRTVSARYLVYRGSYGEQWCNENNVEYAYVTDYRGNVLTRPYNPKEELPAIDEWAQFGDLTFAGDGHVTRSVYYDENGNEVVTGYYVRLAPGAYIQTVADGDSIVYDYNGSEDYERDSSMPDKLIAEDIRPYVTETYGNGYKKGLTWCLEGSYSRHYSVAGIYDIYVDRANGERSPKYHITLSSWEGVEFTDVNESDYFGSPVLWALDMGITDGTSDTTFSPTATCTRGQIVTFLWRTFTY